MADLIKLPRMSDTMTEGKIVTWQKKVGDKIKSGDILAEIETDKATMELESYTAGTLLYIANEKGSVVAVDAVIAIIGKEGEDYQQLLNNAAAPAQIENTPMTSSTEQQIDPATLGVSVIRMPLLSDTMKEGKIIKWNKKIGDTIKSDDNIADVETDKATMEIIPYVAGTLLHIGVKEGDNAAINSVIALIGKKGTDVSALLAQLNAPSKPTAPSTTTQAATPITQTTSSISQAATSTQANDKRVKISPLAKQIASTKGIDILNIQGSGDGGRIIKKDIENFTPLATQNTNSSQASFPSEGFQETSISQMRKTIARRLSESKFSAPHFYLTMKVNMDKALDSRKRLNELGTTKISFNDMVIKAVAVALKKHPNINSSWLGDKIRTNYDVNIGVAVAIPDGLLVPVIRHADKKSMTTIAQEVKSLAQKAKDKSLQPKDWEGNTFTISNLGMFGIDEFTAIINPPDACILAVGGIQQEPIVKNGQIVVGNTMKLCLSCDHRVVDGAMGAEFLQTLKMFLEEPLSMVL